jgi:phosphohistidine phosphatase
VTGIVFLVRHAEAAAGGVDAERRLTAAGRAAFSDLLRRLGPRLTVKHIHCSPFRRARETAELLSLATGAPVEPLDDLASGHAGGRELLDLARESAPGTAMVGHNPEIAEALALASGKPASVPPGTVAALDVSGSAPRLSWLHSP